MTVLFSPSEGKAISNTNPFDIHNLPFGNTLSNLREDILQRYISILNSSDEILSIHTGLKDENELSQLRNTSLSNGTSALFRYTGVGYKYLNPTTINKSALDFLYHNLIIFSNLFGPIYGGSIIPYYKLKQGQSLNGFKSENYFKPLLNPLLDAQLAGDFVLDLRAGFYEKFYLPKIQYSTMQFYKDGKKVSHWAKAYRGKVLRLLSQLQPNSQSEFEQISFEGLQIKEILRQKNATHYCFDIIDSL